ncbi:hypothetical protein [Variovorax sp. J31P207]|nr:hypothetical protein [Variovorax sp. J31P207]MDM0066663.1 hypothetical protein [Variovorax sp. J31P207]
MLPKRLIEKVAGIVYAASKNAVDSVTRVTVRVADGKCETELSKR